MCPLWLLCLSLAVPRRRQAMATGIKGSFAHQDVVPLQSAHRFTKASLCWAHGVAKVGSHPAVDLCHITIIKPHQDRRSADEDARTDWCTGVDQPLNQAWLRKLAGRNVRKKKKREKKTLSSVEFICCCWFNEKSLLGKGTRKVSIINPSSVHLQQDTHILSLVVFFPSSQRSLFSCIGLKRAFCGECKCQT